MRAKWNPFSLVASAPKLQSKLCSNLMTYLLRSAGPKITWYCKETRGISFMCFSFALDCKGRYYGQKETFPCREALHVTYRNSCIQPETEGTHAKRECWLLEPRAPHSLLLQEWFSNLISYKRKQSPWHNELWEIWKNLSSWGHLSWYKKLKHIWNPRIVFLYVAAVTKHPATFTF